MAREVHSSTVIRACGNSESGIAADFVFLRAVTGFLPVIPSQVLPW